MGDLVKLGAGALYLQREDHAKTLAALKKLAAASPEQLAQPALVRAARSLAAAIEAELWEPTFDRHGDLRWLRYTADKLVADADPLAFLGALGARALEVCVVWEEGDETAPLLTYRKWPWWRDVSAERVGEVHQRLWQRDAPPTVAPGATVAVPVVLTRGTMSTASTIRATGEDPHIDVRATFAPFAHDGRGHVELAVGATVRGRIQVAIFDDAHERGTVRVDVVPPPADEPLEVASARHDTSKVFIPASKQRKVLEQLHRYAARHRNDPNGAFLADVEAATDPSDALAAAGLAPIVTASGWTGLAFTSPRLPGSLALFDGIVAAVAVHGKFDAAPLLALRLARSPERERSYTLRYGSFPAWR